MIVKAPYTLMGTMWSGNFCYGPKTVAVSTNCLFYVSQLPIVKKTNFNQLC
jgi:hypothetical protein